MRISVRVRPGAARTYVGGRYGDAEPPVLAVSVRERAVDGRANDAVEAAVAEAFGLRRAAVRIVSGASSRTKIVELDLQAHADGPSLLKELLAR